MVRQAAARGDRPAGCCYWAGVAHLADDAAAERWLARAWEAFEASGDLRGQCLTIAAPCWSRPTAGAPMRAFRPGRSGPWGSSDAGLARACRRTKTSWSTSACCGLSTTATTSGSDSRPGAGRPSCSRGSASHTRIFAPSCRLHASETLIEHAVSDRQMPSCSSRRSITSSTTCSDPGAPAWDLGLWLVAFGAASGRFFRYSQARLPLCDRRGCLRAAIAIGEREALVGVEFGALYHLQLQMKLRNDFAEFARLVDAAGRDRRQPLHHPGRRRRRLPGRAAHAARQFRRGLSRLRPVHGRDRSGERADDRALAALHHQVPGAARRPASRRRQRDLLEALLPQLEAERGSARSSAVIAADALAVEMERRRRLWRAAASVACSALRAGQLAVPSC